MRRRTALLFVAALFSASAAWGQPPADLVEEIGQCDPTVLPGEPPRDMLRQDVRRRLREVNDRSSRQWYAIENREQWERFRAEPLRRLEQSLGLRRDQAPSQLIRHRTAVLQGEGFAIENVVFNSREGLWITANLYRPQPAVDNPPGILICHSHHTPKTHGELQDMGMTWARLGCLVLVMDHFGHGERRQHPFASPADSPRSFRVSRQDYYFRYDNGVQLHLAGESLIGQIVWDLRRGVDYLLEAGADSKRIALLGSVAGGGDPAAVAAALDSRITAAAPFNFGGPQPETRYPLPDDVEQSFNYAGSGSWESTRNLRRSASDGFLPWLIVGGIAPRRLVFAHEFSWDRPRDPVWRRLQKIYSFYERPEHLTYTHGFGELSGRPPDASHCTHIGQHHRKRIHEALETWFGIKGGAEQEYSSRRPASELLCLTDDVKRKLPEGPFCTTLLQQTQDSAVAAAQSDRSQLRSLWTRILGVADRPPAVLRGRSQEAPGDTLRVERVTLEVEPEILVPMLLLHPLGRRQRGPAVVAVAQQGKAAFLEQRAPQLAELIDAGVTVCLPDLRGTGETSPGDSRDRRSAATSLSSSELMLGRTMVGARLGDLRSVLAYLRTRRDVDPQRIAVWGDSFRRPHEADTEFRLPRGIDGRPAASEPLGGLLALLAPLLDDSLAAAYGSGGLTHYGAVLSTEFVYIPHDVVVPGAIPAGDLPAVAASCQVPLRLDYLVDGWNRLAPDQARALYQHAPQAALGGAPSTAAAWLIGKLKP